MSVKVRKLSKMLPANKSMMHSLLFAFLTTLTFITLTHLAPTLTQPTNKAGARGGNSASDSCHLRELELCTMGVMSLFQNPNGLPMSAAEVTRQCEYLKESGECLDSFNQRCSPGGTAKLMETFADSSVQLAQDFCGDDNEFKKNYTRHVGCFRGVQRKHQRHCLTDFQVGFEGIHKLDRPDRAPLACCNFQRLKECILVPLEEECGESAVSMVERLLETVFGGIYIFPCRSFKTSQSTCRNLLPGINRKPYNGRNVSALSRIISSFTNIPTLA